MTEIISDKIKYSSGGQETQIDIQVDESGNLVRKGAPAEMGKRFVCALGVDIPSSDGKGMARQNLTGSYLSIGGRQIDLGCGQEILVTKASPNEIYCCNKPMTRVDPKPLPSSD